MMNCRSTVCLFKKYFQPKKKIHKRERFEVKKLFCTWNNFLNLCHFKVIFGRKKSVRNVEINSRGEKFIKEREKLL